MKEFAPKMALPRLGPGAGGWPERVFSVMLASHAGAPSRLLSPRAGGLPPTSSQRFADISPRLSPSKKESPSVGLPRRIFGRNLVQGEITVVKIHLRVKLGLVGKHFPLLWGMDFCGIMISWDLVEGRRRALAPGLRSRGRTLRGLWGQPRICFFSSY